MRLLIQAIPRKLIDDAIELLDKTPWYVYIFMVLVIILLLLIKPFINHKKNIKVVNDLSEQPQKAKLIDRNIFVRINQQRISKNKLGEVLKNIENFAISVDDKDLLSKIIHLSSRYKEEQNLHNAGMKDISNNIEMNKIKYSLILILNEVIE